MQMLFVGDHAWVYPIAPLTECARVTRTYSVWIHTRPTITAALPSLLSLTSKQGNGVRSTRLSQTRRAPSGIPIFLAERYTGKNGRPAKRRGRSRFFFVVFRISSDIPRRANEVGRSFHSESISCGSMKKAIAKIQFRIGRQNAREHGDLYVVYRVRLTLRNARNSASRLYHKRRVAPTKMGEMSCGRICGQAFRKL